VVGVTLQLTAGNVIVQVSPPGVDVTTIVPEGVPAPGATATTPAVTVTAVLTSDGFGVFALMAVIVEALLTVAVAPPPLLGRKPTPPGTRR
jgi:hypothetical protein